MLTDKPQILGVICEKMMEMTEKKLTTYCPLNVIENTLRMIRVIK
jgi:hypothetical protein